MFSGLLAIWLGRWLVYEELRKKQIPRDKKRRHACFPGRCSRKQTKVKGTSATFLLLGWSFWVASWLEGWRAGGLAGLVASWLAGAGGLAGWRGSWLAGIAITEKVFCKKEKRKKKKKRELNLRFLCVCVCVCFCGFRVYSASGCQLRASGVGTLKI